MSQTTSKTFDVAEIERFLSVRGWTRSEHDYHIYIAPNARFEVVIDNQMGYAEVVVIEHVDGTSEEIVSDELKSLEELERELVSLGAMKWECPSCGRTDGEPRERWEFYQYGADADGNRGEHRTEKAEGCTKCIRGSSGPDYDTTDERDGVA